MITPSVFHLSAEWIILFQGEGKAKSDAAGSDWKYSRVGQIFQEEAVRSIKNEALSRFIADSKSGRSKLSLLLTREWPRMNAPIQFIINYFKD